MIDTNQLRRLNRERVRRGLPKLDHVTNAIRNGWLATYRDGDEQARRRARAALGAIDGRTA